MRESNGKISDWCRRWHYASQSSGFFKQMAQIVASSYVRYPLIQETEGMAEQDPETLFQCGELYSNRHTTSEESTNWAHFFLLQRCMA